MAFDTWELCYNGIGTDEHWDVIYPFALGPEAGPSKGKWHGTIMGDGLGRVCLTSISIQYLVFIT